MKSSPLFSLTTFCLFLALTSTAHAGAGGAGNTNDASLGFDFARTTAIQILQNVTPETLFEVSGREPLRSLYQACRPTLFTGAVQTRFELVSEIPDGDGFHALAQRIAPATIRISRKALEQLQASQLLTPSTLTALVLHEVGHDCIFEGKPVDDSYDPLLNEMAEALLRSADQNALTHLMDVKFIQTVKSLPQPLPLRFVDLSARTRRLLTEQIIDYLGDWAYLKNKASLGAFSNERPARASLYYADLNTSVFLGWAALNFPVNASISVFKDILKSSYKALSPSAASGSLPSQLTCQLSDANSSSVSCSLVLNLGQARQRVDFSLDLFGNLKVTHQEISQ